MMLEKVNLRNGWLAEDDKVGSRDRVKRNDFAVCQLVFDGRHNVTGDKDNFDSLSHRRQHNTPASAYYLVSDCCLSFLVFDYF